jgi:hypothetical protein
MAIAPQIELVEFAVSGVEPVGIRQLNLASSGFVKIVSTSANAFLDFEEVNNTNTKVHSKTAAVYGRVVNLEGATEAVFNMRFWIPDFSDWTQGTFFFNGFASGVWFQNLELTDASGFFIPTILPSGQNLRREDGFPEITGSGTDLDVTEYIFLSISVDSDVDPGVYGGNDGGFTYRMTFDYR